MPDSGCNSRYGRSVRVIDGDEGLRSAALMALAGIFPEKLVQLHVAAIEALAIMLFRDRLFMPSRKAGHLLRLGQRFCRAQQAVVRGGKILEQIQHPHTVPFGKDQAFRSLDH